MPRLVRLITLSLLGRYQVTSAYIAKVQASTMSLGLLSCTLKA